MARILAVNDSTNLLRLFDVNLSRYGHQCKTLCQDDLTVADVEAIAPDLVILGYLRGDMVAEARIVELLRANPTTAHIPILIFTTATEHVPSDFEQSTTQVRVYPKPFDHDLLITAVNDALASRPGDRPLALTHSPGP